MTASLSLCVCRTLCQVGLGHTIVMHHHHYLYCLLSLEVVAKLHANSFEGVYHYLSPFVTADSWAAYELVHGGVSSFLNRMRTHSNWCITSMQLHHSPTFVTADSISKPGMSCAGLYRSVQACTSLTDVQESPPYTGLYRFVQTSFVCTNSIIFADKRNVTYHFWPSHLTWVMWPISHIIICHWQELNPWPQGNNYALLPLSHKTFDISQH